jgi:hypothetical protein
MKHLNWLKIGIGLVIAFVLFGGTSSDTPDIIYWTDEEPLTWDDFQGIAKYDYINRDISALTSSGILHYRGCKDDKIIYKVKSYFEKKESWYKDDAYTDYHLAHEQLHFDVTELHTRKLRKLLSEQNFRCGEEAEFEQYVGDYLQNWETAQQHYDFATHHSVDKKKQKEWHYKIAFELSLLEEFKSE